MSSTPQPLIGPPAPPPPPAATTSVGNFSKAIQGVSSAIQSVASLTATIATIPLTAAAGDLIIENAKIQAEQHLESGDVQIVNLKLSRAALAAQAAEDSLATVKRFRSVVASNRAAAAVSGTVVDQGSAANINEQSIINTNRSLKVQKLSAKASRAGLDLAISSTRQSSFNKANASLMAARGQTLNLALGNIQSLSNRGSA